MRTTTIQLAHGDVVVEEEESTPGRHLATTTIPLVRASRIRFRGLAGSPLAAYHADLQPGVIVTHEHLEAIFQILQDTKGRPA